MVLVRVAAIAFDAARQHVLLLKPVDQLAGEGSLLPIWIGQLEATSILVAVQGAEVPRPLAHDLMRSLLDTVDTKVVRVEITRIDDGTFYADITLMTPAGERTVDARPSDAVALASRVGAPIFVADDVMEEAGSPDILSESDVSGEDVSARLDEFKKFLDDVEPEDFGT